MKLAHVYLEYQTLSLNHTFTYDCQDLPVERGMRVKVPFGNRLSVGFVDHVEEVERYEGRYQLMKCWMRNRLLTRNCSLWQSRCLITMSHR